MSSREDICDCGGVNFCKTETMVATGKWLGSPKKVTVSITLYMYIQIKLFKYISHLHKLIHPIPTKSILLKHSNYLILQEAASEMHPK